MRPSEEDDIADTVDPSKLDERLNTLDGVRVSKRLAAVGASSPCSMDGERRGTGESVSGAAGGGGAATGGGAGASMGGGRPAEDGALLGRRTDVSSEGRRIEESYDASDGARMRGRGGEALEGVSKDGVTPMAGRMECIVEGKERATRRARGTPQRMGWARGTTACTRSCSRA